MIEKLIHVAVNKQAQPYHWHDEMELYFVLKGHASGVVNNESIPLGAGELWLVNRDVVHALQDCSPDLIVVQLQMNMELFNRYIADIWIVCFKCGPEQDDNMSLALKSEIRTHICKIIRLMEADRRGGQKEQEILYECIEILNSLKLNFFFTGKAPQDYQSREQFDRLWRIIDYIFDNCNRKLTVREVADHVYMSDAYLSRMLKTETGENFEETVAHVRAECSLKYLLSSDLSITDISYECGFSAPRYYNAAFERHYRCTPAEFRKKAKKSFHQETGYATSSVVFQHGVSREETLELLKPYDQDLSLAWENRRVALNLDLVLGSGEKPASPFPPEADRLRAKILSCSVQDALRYDNIPRLKLCMEELNLRQVCVEEGDPAGFRELALQNLRETGFQIKGPEGASEEGEAGFGGSAAFGSLFSNGAKTLQYYLLRYCRDMEPPCLQMDRDLFFYRRGEDAAVLLINRHSQNTGRWLLSFQGSASACPYLIRKEYVPGYSLSAAELPGSALQKMDGRLRQVLSEPRTEIRTAGFLQSAVLEEKLEPGQICRITFQKLAP